MSKFIIASLAILLSMVSAHDTSQLVLYEDFIPDKQYE